jgi:hypothetical protein
MSCERIGGLHPISIWKAPIPRSRHEDEVNVVLKGFVRVLSVGLQDDEMVVWYEANPKALDQGVELQVRGTGRQLYGNEGFFLGTVQYSTGAVAHVYMRLLGFVC